MELPPELLLEPPDAGCDPPAEVVTPPQPARSVAPSAIGARAAKRNGVRTVIGVSSLRARRAPRESSTRAADRRSIAAVTLGPVNFVTTLQTWHDFYSIMGMAAGSLVGLLFVGLSLHLRVVVTHEDVKALARVTMASLGLSLVLALFMVIPGDTDPSSTGWEIVGVGIASFIIIGRPLLRGMRSRNRALNFRHLILRFGLTILTFVAALIAGVILITGDYQAGLSWLVGVSISLLVTALRNSWDLLVTVGDATLRSETHPGS